MSVSGDVRDCDVAMYGPKPPQTLPIPCRQGVPHFCVALGKHLTSVPPAHAVLRHCLQTSLQLEAGRRRGGAQRGPTARAESPAHSEPT